MKRFILIILSVLSASLVFGQNDADALRFSQYFYSGTARSMAMGNAFGSLGGDFTSISINPAGLGVYRSSELTITPGLLYINSIGTYGPQSSKYEDFKYDFLLNNFGIVFANSKKAETGWMGTNFAIGYNRVADFSQNIEFLSKNNTSSLLDEFAWNSNNGTGSPYYEDLAWNTDLLYIPDTTAPVYTHDMQGIYGQTQDRTISKKGGIGEYAFSVGGNYNNKLYLGATIGIQRLHYVETMYHSEYDDNGNIPYLESFTFQQHFTTNGVGYNLKFGAIYRPIEPLRLGIAIHTPTLYKLTSEFYTTMDAYFQTDPTQMSDRSQLAVSDYQLITPMRIVASAGFQIKKFALLSADYEFAKYSTMRMRADNENFRDINTSIQDVYTKTNNLRLGAEIKLGNIALRGGYALYGSPYKNDQVNHDAGYSVLSAGLGVRTNSFFLDLGYGYTMHAEKYFLYNWDNNSAIGDIKSNSSKFLATFGFRF